MNALGEPNTWGQGSEPVGESEGSESRCHDHAATGGLRLTLAGLALLACYLLFFHRLADRDLWSSHEARAGMNAQTILEDGSWGLPHLYDGKPELQKPPLYYWLVAGIAWLRGEVVDAWSVRLPAAMAAVGCVLLLVGLGWRRGRTLVGVLAGVVLATAIHFTWLARIGRIDMPLSLTVSATIVAFYLAPKQATGGVRLGWLLGGYLALAAGIMLKGPIGLVLPGAVLMVQRLVEGRLIQQVRLGQLLGSTCREWGVWWGVPLVAVLTVPWFAWANQETNGELFRVFFWYHNVERGLGDGGLRSHPWWFYGPQFAVDFLPWTPALLLAAYWCRHWWRDDPELRLGAVWFCTCTVLLSCASYKRADYLLPAYAGAALFLGCALARWIGAASNSGMRRVFTLGVAIACVLGWVVQVERLRAKELFRDYTRFAALVRRSAPAPEEVIFFRTEAHPLAFHIGRPLTILVQWEDLQARLNRPGTHHVVMSPDSMSKWRQNLSGQVLEPIAANTDPPTIRHEHPLVLLRSRSP
jgi:4-amino-4-deoxy-L-arabinose transferase-like glycosyltransferase